MIIKAITELLPRQLRKYAYTQDEDGRLDISIGKHYAVYAILNEKGKSLYFVHTDNDNVKNMWWMPAELYEVVDKAHPKGWQKNQIEDQELFSYPSLTDWRVSEGIIDGEQRAINRYLAEVHADSTFPTQEQLNIYNADFDKHQKLKDYEAKLKLAKERGWERPDPPD